MKVNFDRDIHNKHLETPAPMVCGIQARREELDRIKSLEGMGKLEEIKREYKNIAAFLDSTLESSGNASEFRLVNAVCGV
ncbi:hypothetical protein MTR_7g084855 [Medicago truncatula]|uniref:Uncharacterized protein n=1 Tax=Medicago truncatula TaxID=3880 RepID=A0A072U281_MEDTR|nr:hypothetical protein MTR_7g084855 [Medicago truncatula]